MSKDESLQSEAPAPSVQDQSTMRHVRRGELVPSRTNPRTHFDQDYLKELAANIKQHRVLQPLLVRPLPAMRLQDTFQDRQPGEPLPTLEIVCGECRWRACGIADEDSIPVLIRELDDVQVLQVQLVENLKRRDLHPLEEAEGFERLIKDHGVTVEEIAAKVGKSESYIYKTLKLLELTPDCREQMYSGKFNRSIALLIATRPDYLQAKIAKDVMEPDFHGEPMSYRAAKKLLAERYELQLSTAVFDIKDASLVAKCGACTSCQKRTCANADLFDDAKGPDACMDPKCFDAKKEAHYAKVAKEAKAKGQTVIQGKEAKEVMPYGHHSLNGYKLLDESEYINGRSTTVRKAIGKENLPAETVIIVDPHTNKPMEALPLSVADKLLKKAAAQKKTAEKAKDQAKEPSEHELKQQYETNWRTSAVRQIFAKVTTGQGEAFGVGVARELALYMCQNLGAEEAAIITELLDLGAVAKNNAIETHVKECPADQVAPALLLVAMSTDLEAGYYGGGATPFIDVLAKDTGVDVAAIQADVKKDMKAAAAARKKEQQEKAAPKTPLQKKITARAKKASAADAKAGIAQALQQEAESANDFEVGQRVQFKMDLKGHGGKLRKVSGKEGTIKAKVGDRSWSVAYGSKSHEVATADYTELEHLEADGDDSLGAGEILLANGVKLEPQAAWPFPPKQAAAELAQEAETTTESAPNAAQAAWPFPTTPKKSRKGAPA